MKLCNDTITIFNRRWDASAGYDTYIPTIIKGVSWYQKTADSVDSTGLHAADTCTLRIPEDADTSGREYLSPDEYAAATSVTGKFTIKNGDIIVKAAVESAPVTMASLRGAYGEITTVLGVTDNRRAPKAPHWKVMGG